MYRMLPAAVTGGAIVWLAMIVLAPLAVAFADVIGGAAASLVYEAASRLCHQRPERSFHIAAVQMPVCARCFGLYASGAAGAASALFGGPPLTIDARTARITLAVAAAGTAITIGLEWLGLWYPRNAVRAMVAVPLGGAAGWLCITALRADSRSALRKEAMRYHA